MVKVSVIIPVYNVAPYLGECLDSVIQQSLTDIEIDLGQYSRMPEGDPECKSTLTCFLESETFQQLSEDASTVSFAVGICAVTGDEVWFRYPETELDTEGAAINGKEGLMQTVTVMPFVDKGDAVMAVEPVNRVESYA